MSNSLEHRVHGLISRNLWVTLWVVATLTTTAGMLLYQLLGEKS